MTAGSPAAERGALTGLRVVECGSGIASAYAAKLLADLGADVVKVEPPDGDPVRRLGPYPGGRVDPERSGLFLYLNVNKRGIVLDLARDGDRAALDRVLARAELLITDRRAADLTGLGLAWDDVHARHPALTVTVVAPFGITGPYADYEATDLTLWAAGGLAYLNGGGPGTAHLPPLAAFGHQASFQGGVHAAVASLGALLGKRRLGTDGQLVEVSMQECLTSILELTYVAWPYMGVVASRLRNKPIQPLDFFECRDGWIFVCCIEEHQWQQFVALMGAPDWACVPAFADRVARAEHWDELKAALAAWTRDRSVRELYEAAQARRVPFAPVSTMGDLLSSAHLAERGFFAEIAHPNAGTLRHPGAPYRFGRTPWRLRMPPPRLGEHTTAVLVEVGVDADAVAARVP